MLKNLTITEYFEKTACGEPVPGGGSIAALSAAAAASLSEMVANLTIGKKGYESVEAEMKEIAEVASGLRDKLIKDIDNDPEAYQQVMAAFKLPKMTKDEKNQRTKAIQDGLKKAALIPMGVAEDAFKTMELAEKVIKKGNKNAVTDGAVAAMAARTAVMAAVYNVKINLASIKDDVFVEKLTHKVQILERQVVIKEKEILSNVKI
ncbi:MAG: cyclodeaminase/cyclohydrolase family protein [Desulfobacterales bacterium]|nr:MAG: cyclodeaminase/cyclohydrolase family protein [Desulfobacterales bacterium]